MNLVEHNLKHPIIAFFVFSNVMHIWTAEKRNRASLPERAVFLYYYGDEFRIDCNCYVDYVGRSRGTKYVLK